MFNSPRGLRTTRPRGRTALRDQGAFRFDVEVHGDDERLLHRFVGNAHRVLPADQWTIVKLLKPSISP
jgi:hypothetical protein